MAPAAQAGRDARAGAPPRRSGATTRPSLAANRRILAALLRSDVEVKGDFNPKIFHQKFVLRDFRDGRATKPGNPALLSGSANFTVTDTHRNLNHVFVFHNATSAGSTRPSSSS